jgi:hypothetical protein
MTQAALGSVGRLWNSPFSAVDRHKASSCAQVCFSKEKRAGDLSAREPVTVRVGDHGEWIADWEAAASK